VTGAVAVAETGPRHVVRAPERAWPGHPGEDETEMIQRLRRGDEDAFRELVRRYQPSMIRLARAHVPSRAVAEEVAQETWMAVLRGLDRFEGRSSLKTWIFRILIKRAMSRGISERRCVAFTALAGSRAGEPAGSGAPAGDSPSDSVLSGELRQRIQEASDELAPRQRQVIVLRDVQGWSSPEVCRVLGLSQANQRVLLHRARRSVRNALEGYLDDESTLDNVSARRATSAG
jgi:RNA polymerase sigma-70 factor (ECF subfamily)